MAMDHYNFISVPKGVDLTKVFVESYSPYSLEDLCDDSNPISGKHTGPRTNNHYYSDIRLDEGEIMEILISLGEGASWTVTNNWDREKKKYVVKNGEVNII